MADRTKSSFSNVSYPGNPNIDKEWGVGLDARAIQCVRNQYAGPGAVYKNQKEATMGTLALPPALPRSPKYQ